MNDLGGFALLLLALTLPAACSKDAGSVCYEAGECGEGLGCVGEGVRRCEKCAEHDVCVVDGKCSAKDGLCTAATNEDCAKGFICTGKGGCTAKNGACVVGGDADCKQSEACQKEGYCKASGNNCIKDPDAKAETEG